MGRFLGSGGHKLKEITDAYPGVNIFVTNCPGDGYQVDTLSVLANNFHLQAQALDACIQAIYRIYTQHNWTPNQRKWLERLAKQLVHEVIIDREFVNHRFADDGGAKQMNKVLGEQLDTVLDELNEAMWPQQSA